MTEPSTVNGIILVIGYGNELLGDDGIGPRVTKAIAAYNYPGVQVRSVRQLVPELAVDVVEAQTVIFVDAIVDPDRLAVELLPVTAEGIMCWCTHIADPRTLLALTRIVYGWAPEAWWLTVPGSNFDFGGELSAVAEENMREAVARITKFIQTQAPGCLPPGEKPCTNGA